MFIHVGFLVAVSALGHNDPPAAPPHMDADFGALSTALHLDDACLRADGELGPMCSSELLQIITEKRYKHERKVLAPKWHRRKNIRTNVTDIAIAAEAERYHRAANIYKLIMWIALALLAVMAAWSLFHCRRSEGLPTDHVVDNTLLRATTPGLGYRRSMRLEDTEEAQYAPWGSTVAGVNLGNGWLQMGELYLPMSVNGKQVITPLISAPGSTAIAWPRSGSPSRSALRRQSSASPSPARRSD